MDQPAQEPLDVSIDDLPLPSGEGDPAQVLRALSVLGNQARPVLPVARDLDAALIAAPKEMCSLARRHGLYRGGAIVRNAGIEGVERNAQSIDAAWVVRDASVPEVHAEQVRIRASIQSAEMFFLTRPAWPSRRAAVEPVPYRRARDAGSACDLTGAEVTGNER